MSIWTAKVTDKGNALLTKLAEGNTLEITTARTGSGTVDVNLLKAQTGVSSPQQTVQIQPISYPEEKKIALPITVTNEGLTASYTFWQIGVYAKDPDEGEILFLLAQAEDKGTDMQSPALVSSYKAEFIFYVPFGQADSVEVTVDQANSVTQAGMENYVSTAIAAANRAIKTEGSGEAYTAVVPGITALETGVSFLLVPHVTSTTKTPTLNVNGLGAKNLRQPLTMNTGATTTAALDTWLTAGKPVRVTYDGTLWEIDIPRPSAASIYGTVDIEQGGTGASTAAEALANLGGLPIINAHGSSHDMGDVLLSGAHLAMYKTNAETRGTPYDLGLTTFYMSAILSFATAEYGTQVAIASGDAHLYIRTLYEGKIGDWKKVI